jgi:hypothetical protein
MTYGFYFSRFLSISGLTLILMLCIQYYFLIKESFINHKLLVTNLLLNLACSAWLARLNNNFKDENNEAIRKEITANLSTYQYASQICGHNQTGLGKSLIEELCRKVNFDPSLFSMQPK